MLVVVFFHGQDLNVFKSQWQGSSWEGVSKYRRKWCKGPEMELRMPSKVRGGGLILEGGVEWRSAGESREVKAVLFLRDYL